MGRTFHRAHAPLRSRVAVRESRRWAGHDARGPWHVLIRQSARDCRRRAAVNTPLRAPFAVSAGRVARVTALRECALLSPPPMSARTRCRKAMQTAPSSPLPGPRRRTGRRRRSVDERASVWAARRSVGDRASAPPAVDGFSRRGRREGGVTTRAAGRQGGRALPHPARPISHPPHPPHPSPSSRPAMGAVFERHFP